MTKKQDELGLTITMVKRFKCVHCGKVGYSAGHMRKHADRCTLNPERNCGMHDLNAEHRRNHKAYYAGNKVRAAMAWLPDLIKFPETVDFDGIIDRPGLRAAIEQAMPAVRMAVDNCPACILAAFRQKKIPIWETGFDFKAESKALWERVNETYN